MHCALAASTALNGGFIICVSIRNYYQVLDLLYGYMYYAYGSMVKKNYTRLFRDFRILLLNRKI